MKKHTPSPPESPLDSGSFDSSNPRLRHLGQPDPISHVFTIFPDIDTATLLSHACETLASLNVLTTDLACELRGAQRSLGGLPFALCDATDGDAGSGRRQGPRRITLQDFARVMAIPLRDSSDLMDVIGWKLQAQL